MATGDKAAAAGLPVVPATGKVNVGYNDINALADALADEKNRILVQQTDPGDVPDGTVWISWS